MSTGRLIYVTGIPGTGIRSALSKFVQWCELEHPSHIPPRVLHLESELQQIALQDVSKLIPNHELPSPDTGANIMDVLRLPKPLLASHWETAYHSVLNKARAIMDNGHDVLLSLHACWYHLGTQEYISGISFRAVKDAPLLITLIDDIYDVHDRLSERFGLLERDRIKESPLLNSILKLQLIINWRAFEILLSRQLASEVGAKHFLFAIKHPCRTLHSVLYTNKPLVYLSHHISHPRILLTTAGKESRGRALIAEIQEFAEHLRDRLTLFEPTAIDEARIWRLFAAGDKVKDETVEYDIFVPALSERWELPASIPKLLYDAPLQSVHRNPMFGEYWHEKGPYYVGAVKHTLTSEELSEITAASQLLKPLHEEIFHQINARDHFLVEQSRAVVAYRPWMSGKRALGVMEELLHLVRLVGVDTVKRFAVIAHPSTDEEARQRLATKAHLLKVVGRGDLTSAQGSLKLNGLDADEEFWRGFHSAANEGNRRLGRYLLDALACEHARSHERGSLDEDITAVHRRLDAALAMELLEAVEKADYVRTIRKDLVEPMSEGLSPIQAAQRVVNIVAGRTDK